MFTLNNESEAVQGLSIGDEEKASIRVYAVDGHGERSEDGVEAVVTIHGAADKPQLSFEKALTLTEASGTNVAEGTFHVIDPDAADARENLTYAVSGLKNGVSESVTEEKGGTLTFTNEYGILTLDPATGKYAFELNNNSDAVRALKPGELYEIRFGVTVTDNDDLTGSGEIIVNIKASNKAHKSSSPM